MRATTHNITFILISILACSPCIANNQKNPVDKNENSCQMSFFKIAPMLAASFGLGLIITFRLEDVIKKYHEPIKEKSHLERVLPKENSPLPHTDPK